jgi:hypothetical protein
VSRLDSEGSMPGGATVLLRGKALSGVENLAVDSNIGFRDMAKVLLSNADAASIARMGDALEIRFGNFLPVFKGEIVGIEPIWSAQRKMVTLRAFGAVPRSRTSSPGPARLPSGKIERFEFRANQGMATRARLELRNLTSMELATCSTGLSVRVSIRDDTYTGSIEGLHVERAGADGNKCTLNLGATYREAK